MFICGNNYFSKNHVISYLLISYFSTLALVLPTILLVQLLMVFTILEKDFFWFFFSFSFFYFFSHPPKIKPKKIDSFPTRSSLVANLKLAMQVCFHCLSVINEFFPVMLLRNILFISFFFFLVHGFSQDMADCTDSSCKFVFLNSYSSYCLFSLLLFFPYSAFNTASQGKTVYNTNHNIDLDLSVRFLSPPFISSFKFLITFCSNRLPLHNG